MKKAIFLILLFSSLSYPQAVRMFLYTADPSGGCQYSYFGQNTTTGKLFFCNNGSWSTSIINGSTTGTAGSIVLSNSPTIVTPSITTGFTIGGIAGNGNIPIGNGTVFRSSTATYPNTTTINQVLYSTAANAIGGSPNLTFDGTTLGIANITGGSSVSQTFTFQTTTGIGATDSFVFKGNNNGSSTWLTILNTGLTQGGGLQIGSFSGTQGGIWPGNVTPSSTNFGISMSAGATDINTGTGNTVRIQYNGSSRVSVDSTGITLSALTQADSDNTRNFGAIVNRWANAYIIGLHSGASSMILATGAGDVTALTLDTGQGASNLATFAGTITTTNNIVRLDSAFTDANASGLQNITGLSWTMPANSALIWPFHCRLVVNQNTAAVVDTIGIQDVTIAPTYIQATGVAETALTSAAFGDLGTGLTTTTATGIISFTPGAIGTNLTVLIDGIISQPSNASSSVIQIMIQQATAADTIIVQKGSFCSYGGTS